MTDVDEQPSDEGKLRGAIESILTSFTKAGEVKAQARLAERMNDPEILAAETALGRYDYEAFQSRYLLPFDDQTRLLIAMTLRKNARLQFLFAEARFVSSHLEKLFIRYEGYSSYVDKTRTIMRSLARFYHLEKPIHFNYGAEYTYSLPQRILKDHDSIVAFFESLMKLHSGHPDEYLRQLKNLTELAEVSEAAD